MKLALGEDAAIERAMVQDREQGWTWNDARHGIICKTDNNAQGRHATAIWYGCHLVTWKMYDQRPIKPKERP